MFQWSTLSNRVKVMAVLAGGITSLIVMTTSIAGAWLALDLPRVVSNRELDRVSVNIEHEVRGVSIRVARSDIDSRGRQITNDTLTLSQLQEKMDDYHKRGETAPDWLLRQIQGVTEMIQYNVDQRKKSTDQMEIDNK